LFNRPAVESEDFIDSRHSPLKVDEALEVLTPVLDSFEATRPGDLQRIERRPHAVLTTLAAASSHAYFVLEREYRNPPDHPDPNCSVVHRLAGWLEYDQQRERELPQLAAHAFEVTDCDRKETVGLDPLVVFETAGRRLILAFLEGWEWSSPVLIDVASGLASFEITGESWSMR